MSNSDLKDQVNISFSKLLAIWGLSLFLITEGVSLFHQLTAWNVRIIWVFVLTVAVFIIFLKRIRIQLFCIEQVGIIDIVIFIIFVLWILYIGYMAYTIVPNNWDSMIYHLPRIYSWMQYKSVSYFSTTVPRQLISPPFTEYAQLNVYWLLGGEKYFNFVQYGSYIADAILTFNICKKIGLNKWGGYIASSLFLSMPIAIAESVTTQVDLFGTLWLLVFVDIVLELFYEDKLTIEHKYIITVGLCAVSVGLGYLAKSNVCFPMAVFLIALFVLRIKKKDTTINLFFYVFEAMMIILALLLPSFIRNYNYCGDILCSDYVSSLTIGTADPRLVFLNVYKNWALNATNSCNGYYLSKIGLFLAGMLKCNADDPMITWGGGAGIRELFRQSYMHDTATNPLMAWLLSLAVVFFFIFTIYNFFRKEKDCKLLCFLSIILLAIFIGYAVVRTQRFGTRLLLPASALGCIFIAGTIYMISKSLHVDRIIYILLTGVIIFLSVKTAIPAADYQMEYIRKYKENPECDDFYWVFINNPECRGAYYDVREIIRSCGYSEIGLRTWGDPYEYPLWIALGNKARISHIVLDDEPGYDYNARLAPQCILGFGYDRINTPIEYNNHVYELSNPFYYMGYAYMLVHYCDDNQAYPLYVREDYVESFNYYSSL